EHPGCRSRSLRMRYSVLDLRPIIEGRDAARAFRNSADLAQHTEMWGYHRYWLAEHHNLPGIASAATSVVIAFIAGKTEIIRVGAGGVVRPSHAPRVMAVECVPPRIQAVRCITNALCHHRHRPLRVRKR